MPILRWFVGATLLLLAGCGSGKGVTGGTLSQRYPADAGIGGDPAVLFHEDFESGWGRWDRPSADTRYLHIETDAALAHGGSHYLRSTVTEADLNEDPYISASTRKTFARKTDVIYVRFYARFVGVAPNPHHWVRFAARADDWNGSGIANTVPPGDRGFWFDLDVTNDDDFMFYAYWYKMRSGRCNDGSATPGCEGDQGTTYYYGNVFHPPQQTPFARDRWVCLEVMARANRVGSSDGELALWVDGRLVEHYRPGNPLGSWLRDRFYHAGECRWSACTEPRPFEGFDFRSSAEVRFQRLFLDAYYQLDTYQKKRQALIDRGLDPSPVQTILYDDVVVATERVGCRVER